MQLAHDRGVKMEELAALYQKTRDTLAEALPQLIWTNEANGTVDYMNQRWNELASTGTSGNREWWHAVYPDDLDRVTAQWRASLSEGKSYQTEARFARKDGDPRWHLVSAMPLPSCLEGGVSESLSAGNSAFGPSGEIPCRPTISPLRTTIAVELGGV